MATQDEHLLRDIARRNWIILGLLILFSLFWWSQSITLGVAGGGMVAIFGHHWRERSLRKMLTQPHAGSAKGFQIGYIIRLAFLGSAIYLLIVKARVAPLALAAGLSVVLLNIFWMTLRRFQNS